MHVRVLKKIEVACRELVANPPQAYRASRKCIYFAELCSAYAVTQDADNHDQFHELVSHNLCPKDISQAIQWRLRQPASSAEMQQDGHSRGG